MVRLADIRIASAFVLISAIVAPFAPAVAQGLGGAPSQGAASEYNNNIFCGTYFYYIAYEDKSFGKDQKSAIDELGGYYSTKAKTYGSQLKKGAFDVSADEERARFALVGDGSKSKEWEQRCLAAAKVDVPASYSKAYGK